MQHNEYNIMYKGHNIGQYFMAILSMGSIMKAVLDKDIIAWAIGVSAGLITIISGIATVRAKKLENRKNRAQATLAELEIEKLKKDK